MTTKQVAEYLGLGVSTLLLYRASGTGPRYVKILKRLVRYEKRDVDAWLAEHKK
jgi:excisionase family DNA binding protein